MFTLVQVAKSGETTRTQFKNYMVACSHFESAKKGGLMAGVRLLNSAGEIKLRWLEKGHSATEIEARFRA